MKIYVCKKILSGNLFNEAGYDEMASAKNLAGLLEETYTEYLQGEYPEAEEIKIDIEIDEASGAEGMPYVDLGGENFDCLPKLKKNSSKFRRKSAKNVLMNGQ
jgi:hypothetical protein